MKQVISVSNMSCQNCVKHVTEHLLELEGVTAVVVDLETKAVTIETEKEYAVSDYRQALSDTIYEVED